MTDTAAKAAPRRTTMVPVTTMEEVPILTEEERAELLASLKEAEAEIAAGRGAEYNSAELREHFVRAHREARDRLLRDTAV